MERRYRESEKKIHISPYVDPGESAVDLPQDIIRRGGDLILLKRPLTYLYPPEAPDLGSGGKSYSGASPGGGGHYGVGGRGGVNAGDYGSPSGGGGGGFGSGSGPGSKYGYHGGGGGVGGPGSYGGGSNSGFHGGGGGGGVGGGAGGYGGSGGGGAGGIYGSGGVGGTGGGPGGLGSPYGRGGSSTTQSDGYFSGGNSGGSNPNNDYAQPSSRNQRGGYPVSIKRSASHGDSSSGFTPAMSDEYDSTRRLGQLASPQKHAGMNAFPVSPADTRLSTWASSTSPGGSNSIAVGGGGGGGGPGAGAGGSEYGTTTTSYKRMYQSSTSKRTTANGAVTFNEYQNQQNEEQGKYFS